MPWYNTIAIHTAPMSNASIHPSTSTQNQIKFLYFKIKLFHLIALLNTKITSVPLSIPKIDIKGHFALRWFILLCLVLSYSNPSIHSKVLRLYIHYGMVWYLIASYHMISPWHPMSYFRYRKPLTFNSKSLLNSKPLQSCVSNYQHQDQRWN